MTLVIIEATTFEATSIVQRSHTHAQRCRVRIVTTHIRSMFMYPARCFALFAHAQMRAVIDVSFCFLVISFKHEHREDCANVSEMVTIALVPSRPVIIEFFLGQREWHARTALATAVTFLLHLRLPVQILRFLFPLPWSTGPLGNRRRWESLA